MSETETLAAVLPAKLSQAVKKRAQDEGRTVSNYIRQVLVNAVEGQRAASDAADPERDNVEQVTR